MSLWKTIRRSLLKTPHQRICEGEASLSYEEMCIFAEAFAERLKGSSYGILCYTELGSAMALLACLAAGKTAIPMTMRYGKEVYTAILDRAAPEYVISDGGDGLRVIPLHAKPTSCVVLNAPAVILFTSGSTGTPKGVMLSEDNLYHNMRDIASYFPIGEEDTILIARPLYHSSVLTGEFLVALYRGAKIVFSSGPFSPPVIRDLIGTHRVTVFGGTPTSLATLSRFVKESDTGSVKTLSVSGECMTEGAARAIRRAFPHAAVYAGYGLSEASPRVAYLPPRLFDTNPTASGIPLPSVSLRVLNDRGEEVTEDEIGEVVVRGPNVMQGYFEDEARSRAVLQNGWLYTGDLACRGRDGLLYVKGRKDDMIIRGGMNVYPAEIENALSADDRVDDVLAYGYREGDTQQIGLRISGRFADTREVMALCRAKLPPYRMPATITLVDSQETALSGKKKRRRL